MSAVSQTIGFRHNSPDNTVTIQCGDAHMRLGSAEVNGQRVDGYVDRDYPYGYIWPDTSHRPCSRDPSTGRYASAFTYNTGVAAGQGPRSVMVLCKNSDTGVEAAAAALKLPNPSSGTDWADFDWQGVSVDLPSARYLSRVVLHEMMHCIYTPSGHYCEFPRRFSDIIDTDSISVDGTLPSGSHEVYGWNAITAMDHQNDKLFNADGFAILAYGMFFRFRNDNIVVPI